MSLFFKSPVDIEILLDGEESRKHVDVLNSVGSKTLKDSIPLYEDGESLSGMVTLRVKEGKRVEHLGVKISVIGSIDMIKVNSSGGGNGGSTKRLSASSSSLSDSRKNPVEQFLCISYDLCPAGELQHAQSYSFMFKDLGKRYESYKGKNVDVSYYAKVTVIRKSTDIAKTKKFWVNIYNQVPVSPAAIITNTNPRPTNSRLSENSDAVNTGTNDNQNTIQTESSLRKEPQPVKLDIGIENCLHIEFEFSKSKYSLKDVIVGRIYFLLTRLKIKHMELSLITRESSGLHSSNYLIDSTAIRYEIMDGSPVKGETIPIRLFLGGYDLTPDMSCNYFNIKNYLSLVIVDEDGRRYFKQSEIVLYRTR
ncbi:hypothetical protein HG535_0C04820 [Zygotorulaspora mrakii]|uniref:Vacuolar protein sorting-associated protein 26 n=1 Tax=Zygotorulaspora mrakii TaxID=42260 RepID=A0A7H9B0H2_ZYGMR|nr:uncharacterized protein HG535_0C04820 [Zygotorulaspora mrakii]QLG72128.1 hypothetical protein HG535_0C04820 [Zygotorulaspora mrakii]